MEQHGMKTFVICAFHVYFRLKFWNFAQNI